MSKFVKSAVKKSSNNGPAFVWDDEWTYEQHHKPYVVNPRADELRTQKLQSRPLPPIPYSEWVELRNKSTSKHYYRPANQKKPVSYSDFTKHQRNKSPGHDSTHNRSQRRSGPPTGGHNSTQSVKRQEHFNDYCFQRPATPRPQPAIQRKGKGKVPPVVPNSTQSTQGKPRCPTPTYARDPTHGTNGATPQPVPHPNGDQGGTNSTQSGLPGSPITSPDGDSSYSVPAPYSPGCQSTTHHLRQDIAGYYVRDTTSGPTTRTPSLPITTTTGDHGIVSAVWDPTSNTWQSSTGPGVGPQSHPGTIYPIHLSGAEHHYQRPKTSTQKYKVSIVMPDQLPHQTTGAASGPTSNATTNGPPTSTVAQRDPTSTDSICNNNAETFDNVFVSYITSEPAEQPVIPPQLTCQYSAPNLMRAALEVVMQAEPYMEPGMLPALKLAIARQREELSKEDTTRHQRVAINFCKQVLKEAIENMLIQKAPMEFTEIDLLESLKEEADKLMERPWMTMTETAV